MSTVVTKLLYEVFQPGESNSQISQKLIGAEGLILLDLRAFGRLSLFGSMLD